jgi:hypothetical protein
MARLLAVASTLVLAIGLASGCGGGGGSTTAVTGGTIGFEQLASAADESANAASGRFAFELAASFPGGDEPFSFAGEGAFDAESDRASIEVDLSSLAAILAGFVAGLGAPTNEADLPDFDDPDAWLIQAIQDGDVSYVRFPAFDDQLPDGKTWIRSNGGANVGGLDVDQFTSADPRTMLEFLRGVSGEIETVGVEELRGVPVTHYRALIDPLEYEQNVPAEKREELKELAEQFSAQTGLTTIPVDVWLDANGLVRKLAFDFAGTDPSTAKETSASLSFEIWDFGEDVEISLPPASAVVDESELDD